MNDSSEQEHRATGPSTGSTAVGATSGDDRRPFSAIVTMAAWFVPTALAAVPIAAILLRSVYLANGDIQQTETLLVSLNLTGLLLAAIFVLIQTGIPALLWAIFRNIGLVHYGPENLEQRIPRRVFIVALALILLLAAATTTMWQLTLLSAFTTAILSMHTVIPALEAQVRKYRRVLRALTTILVAAYSTGLILVLAVMPFPALDLVKTEDGNLFWAYTVSVDDAYTTLLMPDGGIVRMQHDSISERATCPDEVVNPTLSRSLLGVLLGKRDDHVPSICLEPPPLPANYR